MDDGEAKTPPRRRSRVTTSRSGRAGKNLVLCGAAIGAITLVAAWHGARLAETEILETEAAAFAATWVALVRADLPDLEGLLAGRRITALDRAVFGAASRAGDIGAYRLRDARGRLVLGNQARPARPVGPTGRRASPSPSPSSSEPTMARARRRSSPGSVCR